MATYLSRDSFVDDAIAGVMWDCVYYFCVLVFWLLVLIFVFFFFFSSRRRHTRFDCDWSSDVCSSDLAEERRTNSFGQFGQCGHRLHSGRQPVYLDVAEAELLEVEHKQPGRNGPLRSEERRVGKECRSRWSP